MKASTPATTAHVVRRVDFATTPVGPYSLAQARRDWGDVPWANFYDRAQVVALDDDGAARGLRIRYPAGAVQAEQGGAQFVVALPPTEELWLAYQVRFEPGFDFVLGGKLPGLTSGGGTYTGGNKPTAGDGWSARYMWREGGRAVLYLYAVDLPGVWGVDLPLANAVFMPGTWHRLTQRIRVNTPGQADGRIDVWFDGQPALARADLRLRLSNQGLIDSLFFSTFHGGSGAEWAPRVDSYATFTDFIISAAPLA